MAGSMDAPQSVDEELDEAGVDTELPPDVPTTEVENEDGSVDIALDEKDPRDTESAEFTENLAEWLDPIALGRLASKYMDLAEQDIENRKKRDKAYAEGMAKAGLSEDATTGGAEFDGASRVVHPMLSKACVEFQSRSMKELFPSGGAVKTKIIGDQTEDKVDKAERKREYMNWQLATQIEEYRAELEKLLSQVPLAGAQYKRWWWDKALRRPRTETVYLENVFLPYGQSDFYTTPRLTYRQYVQVGEFENRTISGLYRDVGIDAASSMMYDNESHTQRVVDRIEGTDKPMIDEDGSGTRTVYQIELTDYIEEDDFLDGSRPAPYIMHLDVETEQVLGLYRNWKESDDRLRKKHWMTEWSFIPWRGGPALGFANIIGGLSTASTGSLRALMDAAHIQNFPGAMALKGAQATGQSTQVSAGQLAQISVPAGSMDPDIRKLVMPFPFNGPSDVLFKLMEWLTAQAEATVSVAAEKIADSSDMAMGTALALIEHGSANFRAVHARLHASMAKDLEILHRLNAENMDDEETVEDLGEFVAYRADFEGPVDIQPVSDPNIFTEAQRYAQAQAVMQLKADPQFVGFFKPDQLLGRTLRLLGIPDIDAIANLPKEPKRLTACDENYAIAMQERPLKAYKDQNHLEHLKSHVIFATSPTTGGNPLIAAGVLTGMLQHCKEHLMMFWRQHIEAAREAVKIAYAMTNMGEPEDLEAQAAAFCDQQMAQQLGTMVTPALQKMQEMVAQQAQAATPQADPNTQLQEKTKLQIAQLDDARDKQLQQIEAALTQASDQSTERLAKLASAVELIQTQQHDATQFGLQKLSGEQSERLAVLNAALQELMGQVQANNEAQAQEREFAQQERTAAQQREAAESAQSNDMRGQVEQVVAKALTEALGQSDVQSSLTSMQQSLMDIIGQERTTNQQAFAQLQEGMAKLARPRVSETFVDKDGKKRARAYYEDEAPPSQPQQGPQ